MARRTRSISIFAAVLVALLALWAPAALAHHKDDHTQGGQETSETSEDTKGNDRKSGYEDNSSEPQETNQGAGSDHDGDADSDGGTAYTEDNDTNDNNTANNVPDDGDNAHPSGKDRSVENGGSGNQGKSESNPDDSKGPMRYEGKIGDDKPNGPGGTDLADQDGNNGCGNDDDFDDDNNGWCGKPTRVKPSGTNTPVCDADATMAGVQKCEEIKGDVIVDSPTKPCDADATMPGTQKCEKPDDVLGGEVTKTCPAGTVMDASGNCLEVNPSAPTVDSVLGVRVNAAAQPAAVAPAAVAPAAVAPAPAAQGAVLPFTGASDLLPLVTVALLLIAAGALGLRGRLSSK